MEVISYERFQQYRAARRSELAALEESEERYREILQGFADEMKRLARANAPEPRG